MATDPARLLIHIDTDEPMELRELTATLGAVSRQYQEFAVEHRLADKGGAARLLVSEVSPGSVTINLLPDVAGFLATSAPLLLPLISQLEIIEKFAAKLKKLIDFLSDEEGPANVSIADCEDAVNIVNPVADHGGTQNITVINGPISLSVLHVTREKARKVLSIATERKAELEVAQQVAQHSAPEDAPETRRGVAMMWKRLDRDKAKTEGQRSPDHGLIEEIDPKPHAVLFTDDLSSLKGEMIADEDNPYQQLYFVDVEVSRAAGGKVAAYRVVGYHGKEPL